MSRQKKPAEVVDLLEWKITKTETQPATAPAAVDASAEDERRQRHEEDARVLRERCHAATDSGADGTSGKHDDAAIHRRCTGTPAKRTAGR